MRKDWSVWSTTASVVVFDERMLGAAERITREVIQAVDDACSRFRDDSELSLLRAELPAGARVSPLLAELVRKALLAASWTDGSVDPTLGNDLIALGYDRDFTQLVPTGRAADTGRVRVVRRAAGWRRVGLDGDVLTVPADIRLDLGASAKATAADLAAARVVDELGGAVLVGLGGDIATLGAHTGWEVVVQDTDADPRQQVMLTSGFAMATSSTQKRRWDVAGRPVHHILDPRFGLPADPVWRSVSVVARSCLRANALSTAAIVRGVGAVEWLESVGAPARLVDRNGRTTHTPGWPHAAEYPEGSVLA